MPSRRRSFNQAMQNSVGLGVGPENPSERLVRNDRHQGLGFWIRELQIVLPGQKKRALPGKESQRIVGAAEPTFQNPGASILIPPLFRAQVVHPPVINRREGIDILHLSGWAHVV